MMMMSLMLTAMTLVKNNGDSGVDVDLHDDSGFGDVEEADLSVDDGNYWS